MCRGTYFGVYAQAGSAISFLNAVLTIAIMIHALLRGVKRPVKDEMSHGKVVDDEDSRSSMQKSLPQYAHNNNNY